MSRICRRLHAWHFPKAFDEGFGKRALFFIAMNARHAHLERQQAGRVEAGINGGELDETVDQQAPADQQQRRERHFGHNQRVLEARPR